MPDRPLLIMPQIGPPLPRQTKKTLIADTYKLPSRSDQARYFGPRFDSMLQAFVSKFPQNTSPENTLVLETTGKVEGFQAAVAAIPGLKWLAEIDIDSIESDNRFFDRPKVGPRFFKDRGLIDLNDSKLLHNTLQQRHILDENYYLIDDVTLPDIENAIPETLKQHKEKILEAILQEKANPLIGRMYLSASNRQALEQIKRLFYAWQKKKQLPYGAGVWANIFSHLRAIRFWDVEDRIRDTGVMDYWQEEVEVKRGTASTILFEIELHYSENRNSRSVKQQAVEELVAEENGRVTAQCQIPEIRFHALKVELPVDNVERVLSGNYGNLFKSASIYLFRPSMQCCTGPLEDGIQEEAREVERPEKSPVIALLDGCPFSKHKLLEQFLTIDDPDDFEAAYQPGEQRHGTQMASLICHSELDSSEQPLKRRIYVRPILKPDDDFNIGTPRPEKVPKNVFFEDILERSVRRIFEGDGEIPPQAPTIRIVNLSVADPDRVFHHFPSPTARLLDWLSYKYNVLFCVSAGNIRDARVQLGLDETRFSALDKMGKLSATLAVLDASKRNRRILSPSESINALSVGALHDDMSLPTSFGRRIDILPSRVLPSPISTLGHGFGFSVKPDLLLPGGRQLYNHNGAGLYEPSFSGQAPGQKVATAPVNPGEVNRFAYSIGTSNATALATRGAGRIYDALESLFEYYELDFPYEKTGPLIKALLVHSATWGDAKTLIEKALLLTNGHQTNKEIARYLGYGIPDVARSVECTANRATAIGFGTIEKDQRHEYRFPLPPSLSSVTSWRRLTVTLAWFSPIAADNRKYRKAALSFEAKGLVEGIGGSRQEAQWQQVRNGTVQHEIIEGQKVVTYQEGHALVIPIQCREDAGPLDVPIHYGLAVSLEVKEGVPIPIYEEVRARIEIAVREQIADTVR